MEVPIIGFAKFGNRNLLEFDIVNIVTVLFLDLKSFKTLAHAPTCRSVPHHLLALIVATGSSRVLLVVSFIMMEVSIVGLAEFGGRSLQFSVNIVIFVSTLRLWALKSFSAPL